MKWINLLFVFPIFCNAQDVTTELTQASNVVETILHDNQEFAKHHQHTYFEKFAKSQHPRATVITCADSRVHDQALEHSPDNDLFIIRNIGNQISTSEGSVEYGVHHLHTPLLLIIGHSSCGAIKAANKDFSHESPAIKHELSTIHLTKKSLSENEEDVMEGVKENVNHQVSTALHKFNVELKQNHLMVIGAVYDFTNAMHHGEGKLIITNVNGNTQPEAISKFINATQHHKPKDKHHHS